ncbi:MAG TPA: (2Fe-2S)-binding protein [Kofleriaceae bacterium]|jgi:isoquinoline 1-oxidoreductase alpha subunit
MATYRLNVNGSVREVDAAPDMPLLWVLRDLLTMVGTKFGCGVAQCRACTVHLDGKAVPSCQIAVEDVGEKKVTTIEGLPPKRLDVLVDAWIAEEVPQCGYCQPGQIMAAAALLGETPHPTDDDIEKAVKNICRCGTYNRIKKAIHRAAGDGR